MRNAAILDGDVVIVRQQTTAANGEIVVATLAGETTVKRLRIGDRGAELVPENPEFRSIPVRDEHFRLHGVVVAVMRSLPWPSGLRAARRDRAFEAQVGRSGEG